MTGALSIGDVGQNELEEIERMVDAIHQRWPTVRIPLRADYESDSTRLSGRHVHRGGWLTLQ